jgi:hypothetical protein
MCGRLRYSWKKLYRGNTHIFQPPLHVHHTFLHTVQNGLIYYVDTKAKCRHLKKITCKGTMRNVFIRVYRLENAVSRAGILDPAL